MRISDLILELQDIQRRSGDLAEVVVRLGDGEELMIDEASFHGGSTVEILTERGW